MDSLENIRRFRAVVQHLNLKFSELMHTRGHKYSIQSRKRDENTKTEHDTSDDEHDSSDDDRDDHPCPIKMTRDESIEWVQRTLERSRGCELPGNFNPLIISQLFWEQSTHWDTLAHQHIFKVSESCKAFVKVVFEEAAPSDIRQRLSDSCVDIALENSLKAAEEELNKIMEDKGRHPMTYNGKFCFSNHSPSNCLLFADMLPDYFTSNIQESRKSKFARIAKAAEVSWEKEDGNVETYIKPEELESNMHSGIEQNMDKFSAEDALNSQVAYYADELKYFINCIAKQVVERHLVDTLSSNVLSPHVIAGLTDEQIGMLTAEAPEVSRNRERLEEKQKVLERGLKIFKEALGGFT